MNVIVSGGSRGLGLELCRSLVARGEHVASFARSATPETEALVAEADGRFRFDELDATDLDGVAALVRDVDAAWEGIDGLVNNAAVGQDALLAHLATADVGRLLRINLEAPIVLTRAVVRSMLRRSRPGRIVMVSSICATQGYPGLTVYSAAKGGMDAFTRSLVREVGGRIRVNTVAPGFFESEMSAVLAPAQRETIVRRTPTGQLATFASVVPVIELLLDPAVDLNGALIRVDGGAST